jgi:hypothetical protein
MTRKQLTPLALLIALLVIAFTLQSLLLHGQPVVRLAAGPPLAGIVSQSLGISGANNSLPVVNKDYTLQNINYFNDRSWVVVSVVPINNNADKTIVVMHMTGGLYQVVLGPGSAFPDTYLQNLPADVSQYLMNRGVVYEPANN